MSRADLLAFQESVLRAVDGGGRPPSPQPQTRGIDPAKLRLVGMLVEAKRVAKIEAVLPRTGAHLGPDFMKLARQFARSHPATSFRSWAEAARFYQFLRRRRPPCLRRKPYLLDLAHCELALSMISRPALRDRAPRWRSPAHDLAVRRQPGLRLHVCRFDVRRLLEDTPRTAARIPAVPTHLAILADPPVGEPRLVQVSPDLHEFLRSLGDWTYFERGADPTTTDFLGKLEQLGLVQQRARRGSRRSPAVSGR
jgi:hypothetical protein